MTGRSGSEPSRSRILGLRVDVCTHRGLYDGVPELLRRLARARARATFFVAMGPDRSGRAARRVLTRPGFLRKMLRTRGLAMYGVRTALYGTVLPSPLVGSSASELLRAIRAGGHELGIHSWDHVTWHDRLDRWGECEIAADYREASVAFVRAAEEFPEASAAPGWLASAASLRVGDGYGFRYASDVRGEAPFLPVVNGEALRTPQVPATMATLDEAVGRERMTAEEFFAEAHETVARSARREVFTAHAEAEGRSYARPFERWLRRLASVGVAVVPLGEVLDRADSPLPHFGVERSLVPGRAGAVSIQATSVAPRPQTE